MYYNRKRHKTLRLLSPSFILFNSNNFHSDDKFGISFENLSRELKMSRENCEKVFIKLYNDSEVKYTNTSVVGLYLTHIGLESYTNKKYINANNKILVNCIKNTIQIIIPVLSLIIAFLALSLKFTSFDKKVNELNELNKTEIQNLQFQLDSIRKVIKK